MKLVDILARELKEWPTNVGYIISELADLPEKGHEEVTRAQWQEAREALSKAAKPGAPMPPISEAPKDATHWDPGYDSEPTWACKMGGVWNWHPVNGAPIDYGWRVYPFQGDSLESRLVLIGRPWNGKGLPPVGTVCERRTHPEAEGGRYEQVRIIAHTSKGFPVWENTDAMFAGISKTQRMGDHPEFRPIRTPEQIAAEEREKDIAEMVEIARKATGFGQNRADYAALYDAGYRKVGGAV